MARGTGSDCTVQSATRSGPRVGGRAELSADGWILRPEYGEQSYRSHAVALHQTLYAMTPAERFAFAEQGGGRMAPTGVHTDERDDCLQVVRGTKPAALTQSREKAAVAVLAELGISRNRSGGEIVEAYALLTLQAVAKEHGLIADNDRETGSLALSRSPECIAMLDESDYEERYGAWRHILRGVALGYSDADIARFLSREEMPMDFELDEHCLQVLAASGNS